MKKKKSLVELRTQGFNKLYEGKIHMRCPSCGRKQSNMNRENDDPANAFLVEIYCDNCCQGCKDNSSTYFDKNGEIILEELE